MEQVVDSKVAFIRAVQNLDFTEDNTIKCGGTIYTIPKADIDTAIANEINRRRELLLKKVRAASSRALKVGV